MKVLNTEKFQNKLRKKLLAIKIDGDIEVGEDLKFGEIKIGKILIDKPHSFALVKLFDPDFSDFKDKELNCGKVKVKIISSY